MKKRIVLNFNNSVKILIISLLALVLIAILLNLIINGRLDLNSGDQSDVMSYLESTTIEGVTPNISKEGLDMSKKDQNFFDTVPYYGEKFIITYDDVEDRFDVFMDTSTDINKDAILSWLQTFQDMQDLSKVSIKFIIDVKEGPPVGP